MAEQKQIQKKIRFALSSQTSKENLSFVILLMLMSLVGPGFTAVIVNPDMVWKPGGLQSVYNELSFYVELGSSCTNLLKFCSLIFQKYG